MKTNDIKDILLIAAFSTVAYLLNLTYRHRRIYRNGPQGFPTFEIK
jgi:hypothetical protein